MNTLKLYISHPKGTKKEEIQEIRSRISKMVKILHPNDNIETIHNAVFDDYISREIPVYCLGKRLQLLSEADIVYFGGRGWESYRGCICERLIVSKYPFQEVIEEEYDDHGNYQLIINTSTINDEGYECTTITKIKDPEKFFEEKLAD